MNGCIYYALCRSRASQVAQWVKNLLAVQETQEMWVQSLSQEDPLEDGIKTHFSIFAWRILWTEEPVRIQLMGSQRVGHDCETEHTSIKALSPNTVTFGVETSMDEF